LYNTILHNGKGVVVEDPARPVLQGNTFRDNIGDAVTLPASMEREPVLKFNFLLPAKPPARRREGAR